MSLGSAPDREPDDRPGGAQGDTPGGSVPSVTFHLFVYGTLRSDRSQAALLEGCERITEATIDGTLYQLDEYPALILYGETPVRGEVWRCPADRLWQLDEYEGVGSGLFRRIGIEVGEFACWTYVAGPALAHRLTPARRLRDGDWSPAAPQ